MAISRLVILVSAGICLAGCGDTPAPAVPTEPWRFEVVDSDGTPTPARLTLRTVAAARVDPRGVRSLVDKAGEPYFYANGSFSLESGETELDVTVHKGFEIRPISRRVRREAEPTRLVLERVFDMKRRGYRSGDGHIHDFALGTPYQPTNREILWEMKAEDLHLANVLAGNLWDEVVLSGDRITGVDEPESEPDRLLRYSEEYRGNHYGHMVVFGVSKLSDPVFTAFEGTPYPFDFPMNLAAARRYRSEGAFASFAHLQSRKKYALEFPVDVVLNALAAIEIQGYAVIPSVAIPIWEKMLSSGFEVVLTAGTDVMLASNSRGVVGGGRSYVALDGRPFTYEGFQQQLERGRSFTTNGPLLFLEVDGQKPGERIALQAGESRSLDVRVVVESLFPWETLLVRMNQQDALVFESGSWSTEASNAAVERQVFEGQIDVDGPAWIYATVTGPRLTHLPRPIGNPRKIRAISSPVWVEQAGRALADPASIDYFRSWIRRVRILLDARDNFGSEANRTHVLETLDEADRAFVSRLSGVDASP